MAARFEDGRVECLIQVANPKVNRLIESGEISAVSIEGMYLDGSNNKGDTEYPTSLHFQALALLTQDDTPGDPLTRIFKEGVWEHKSTSVVAIQGVIMEKIIMPNTADSEWSTAQVNDLPDSSFAYIEPGGSKDSDGKTVPRDKRHLPYKGADGKPDAPHVRNALARLDQTDVPDAAKAEAKGRLSSAAKALGIEMSERKLPAPEVRYRLATQAMSDYAHGIITKYSIAQF